MIVNHVTGGIRQEWVFEVQTALERRAIDKIILWLKKQFGDFTIEEINQSSAQYDLNADL